MALSNDALVYRCATYPAHLSDNLISVYVFERRNGKNKTTGKPLDEKGVSVNYICKETEAWLLNDILNGPLKRIKAILTIPIDTIRTAPFNPALDVIPDVAPNLHCHANIINIPRFPTDDTEESRNLTLLIERQLDYLIDWNNGCRVAYSREGVLNLPNEPPTSQ